MSDLFENLQMLEDTEKFYEMANISKKRTKFRYDIWVDSAGSNRHNEHNIPRVKVNVDGTLIPISISKNPEFLVDVSKYKKIKDIKPIFDFISKFEDVLLMHWNGEIDDYGLLGIIFDTLNNLPNDDAIRKYAFNEEN